MELEKLRPRAISESAKGFGKQYLLLQNLLEELQGRTLPDHVMENLNGHIRKINDLNDADPGLERELKSSRNAIIKVLEKELKLVPKDYYKKLWMALGMTVFGLPLGLAFGLSIGNIGMMAIGLPIGMAIGVAVGSRMDQKALQEGRQLTTES